MLRKSMIALCAAAAVAALVPNISLARGGGGGGGGHGGGGGGFGGGHAGGFGGGGFGGGRAGGFSAGGFGGARAGGINGGGVSSFARAAPVGAAVGVGAVAGAHFANGQFNRGGFDHGFRHGRFFAGGVVGPYYDGYADYTDYSYDDSYGDNGNCYVVQRRVQTAYGWQVRPVQVCG
jgi:hypothetical protein